MGSNFRLLVGGNPYIFEELPEDMAGWVYVSEYELDFMQHYVIKEGGFYGIANFLSMFEQNHRVKIISIEGPNGIKHSHNTQYGGWGFNIQRDQLIIRWVEPALD